MSHAKSLRVIGQSLETAKLQAFELVSDGHNYAVQSAGLNAASEWILRHALIPNDFSVQSPRPSGVNRSVQFTPADIARLDDQALKQRRAQASTHPQIYRRLSQLLRTLGDHLDRSQIGAFQIAWSFDSASVAYQSSDGASESRSFTAEKLEHLGSHSRFRRASRARSDIALPGALKQPGPRKR